MSSKASIDKIDDPAKSSGDYECLAYDHNYQKFDDGRIFCSKCGRVVQIIPSQLPYWTVFPQPYTVTSPLDGQGYWIITSQTLTA